MVRWILTGRLYKINRFVSPCLPDINLFPTFVRCFIECDFYFIRRKLYAGKIMFHVKATVNLHDMIFCSHNFIRIQFFFHLLKSRVLRFISHSLRHCRINSHRL